MQGATLRARALVSDHLRAVVVGLLVLSAAGGWLAYDAAADPSTTTETRVVSAWSTTGAFDHRATVVSDNPVYPVGTTLDERPVYFRAVSPSVEGTFRFGYDAAAGNLSVAVRATLVVDAVERDADPGTEPTVLWRTTRDLGRRRATGLAPGGTVAVPFAVNATRVARRTAAIRDALGGVGGVRTRVVVDVSLRGRVDGRPVRNGTRYALPLSIERTAVRVDDPGPVTARHERTRRVRVTRDPGRARVVAGALLAVLPAAALVGLLAARRRGALGLAPAERAALDHRRARREFADWVTAGSVPREVRSWPRVEVASLEGLVDAAIDSDARVIEDDGAYFVPHGGLLYVHVPPDGGSDVGAEPGSAGVVGAGDGTTPEDGPASDGDERDAPSAAVGGGSGGDGAGSDGDA